MDVDSDREGSLQYEASLDSVPTGATANEKGKEDIEREYNARYDVFLDKINSEICLASLHGLSGVLGIFAWDERFINVWKCVN